MIIMKRMRILLQIICICLMGIAFSHEKASAEEESYGNFSYILENGVLTITGTGEIGYLDKLYMQRSDRNQVREIVVKEGITDIKNTAFYMYDNLKSVVLPNSMTIIRRNMFASCYELEEVMMGAKTTRIEYGAFRSCSSMKQIKFPESLRMIGEDAFKYCKSLEKIFFGKGLKRIKREAFNNCKNLRKVMIPDSVEKIEEGAFSECEKMTTLILPSSLKSWDKGAAEKCIELKKVINRSKISCELDTYNHCKSWKVSGKTVSKVPAGKTAIGRGKKVQLKYKLLGGTPTGKLTTSYVFGTVKKLATHVKKKGYVFMGWDFEGGDAHSYEIGPDVDRTTTLRPLWFKYKLQSNKKEQVKMFVSGQDAYGCHIVWQVRYSEHKNMKNATVVKPIEVKVNRIFKGLKSGKRYYYQFRCAADADDEQEPWVWLGKRSVVVK